jgi:hypothetical protein
MSAAQHTPGPWEVKRMAGMRTGCPAGYTVERVNRTKPEGCDLFERGRIFCSEAAARAAIAKATGSVA